MIEPSSPSVPTVISAVQTLMDSEPPEKGAPMLRSPDTDHAFLAVPADKGATQATDVSDRDRRVFASANPDQKVGKRKKLTARKEVQVIIAHMYPASCGPPCKTAPVPAEVLKLNEEYKDLFPAQLPPGLPPRRPTDHRIDFMTSTASRNPDSTDSLQVRTSSCKNNWRT